MDDAFKLLASKMQYHSSRQSVLSQNIANANTPEYKAMDIKKPNFKKMVKSGNYNAFGATKGVSLANTHHNHIAGFSISSSLSGSHKMATYEKVPVENDVDLGQQIFEASQNNLEHSQAVSTYRKMMQIMRISISGNSGGG